MTEKNEQTEQEKKAEFAAKLREVAIKNLNSKLWTYAAPKLISSTEYGKLAEASGAMYGEIIQNTPDQHIYETLFLPQLASEGGAITNPYIQATSEAILRESLKSVKVSDAIKYANVKGTLKTELTDKYVNQLDEQSAELITANVIRYQTDEVVKGVVGKRQGNISKGLEELLCESPKK